MKKNSKKLLLARETMKTLGEDQLEQVAGGSILCYGRNPIPFPSTVFTFGPACQPVFKV